MNAYYDDGCVHIRAYGNGFVKCWSEHGVVDASDYVAGILEENRIPFTKIKSGIVKPS